MRARDDNRVRLGDVGASLGVSLVSIAMGLAITLTLGSCVLGPPPMVAALIGLLP